MKNFKKKPVSESQPKKDGAPNLEPQDEGEAELDLDWSSEIAQLRKKQFKTLDEAATILATQVAQKIGFDGLVSDSQVGFVKSLILENPDFCKLLQDALQIKEA